MSAPRRRVGVPYESKPPRGRARRIWTALADSVGVSSLWYNPNCWGATTPGWGTWAFSGPDIESFCGEMDDGSVYIQQSSAPYGKVYVS